MNRIVAHVLLAALLFAGFATFELLGEDEAISIGEFVLEDAWPWLLLSLAVAAASELAFRTRDGMRQRAGLSAALSAAERDGEIWRASARHYSEGLALAMREQFHAWRLTPGESDIALLLLKGLSHKEVAQLRGATPATVRQQAASIYQKSGLASRAELAAYFLEDLFPSRPVTGAVASPARLPDAAPIQHMS